MNSKLAANPPIRRWECVLILLTILILASAVAILIGATFPSATAGQYIAPERTPVETARAKKFVGPSMSKKAKPAAAPVATIVVPARGMVQQTGEPEPQEPPARGNEPAAARPATSLAVPTGSPFAEFAGPIILTTSVVFALGIVAVLVLVVGILGLIRWHDRRFGPLIRIEHIGAAPIAVQAVSASVPPAAPVMPPAQAAAAAPPLAPAQQPAEAPAQRPADPLIQRMLEDALELQAQIDLNRKEGSSPTLREAHG